MADQGPTTVGSIVAKLKFDILDWIEKETRVKKGAEELGRLSPNIQVDADVATALARLEAVRAAQERINGTTNVGTSSTAAISPAATPRAAGSGGTDALAAAERRLTLAIASSESATQRAIVAEMRLDERREKGGMSAAQLAAAELAAAEAIRRSEKAAEDAAIAEARLAAAENAAAAAARAQALAEDESTNSKIQANEANKTSVTRMGMIATAIGTLIPMLVPLAAFTVGAAGALSLMGVAGVFAIVGIKREMAEGTAVGQAYSEGIASIKDDMSELAKTGANATLASFQRIARETNAEMPSLNTQVGNFAGLLGRSGANLFVSALTGARVLNPLLLTTGVYVESLTKKFELWTGNGGLEKFGMYAMRVLPQVTTFLGALATMVMHVLEALAPLGSAGFVVLTGVSQAIAAIPVEVLGVMIESIIYGTIAFKAWGFVAPLLATVATRLGMVGAAATIATGPIGWIVAGVGALAAVLTVAILANQNATKATGEYTAAVEADTGAIGENVRAKAAQILLDNGVLASARKLGISAKLATDYALGQKDAIRLVNAELEENEKKLASNASTGRGAQGATAGLRQESDRLRNSLQSQTDDIGNSVKDYQTLQEALGTTTAATAAQQSAAERNAAAAGVSAAAYLAAADAQGDTKLQLEKTTAAMFIQNDAAGLLKQQLDLLNGKTLNAAQAQNQFDSQLANMADHMDKTGKQIDRANTLLTGNTAAAVANRGELISLTQAAENNAQAFRDNGGSAEETMQKLNDMKQSIIDNAVAHGENADEVKAYVDEIFKIPASIPPTKIEVDTAAAMAKIAALVAKYGELANLRVAGVSVSSSAQVSYSDARNSQGHADGGTVTGAGSGTSDSVMRRLSVGEEVIKTASASQARPFLKAFNNDPKSALAAAGAANAPAVAGSTTTVEHHWHITTTGDAKAAVKDGIRQLGLRTS